MSEAGERPSRKAEAFFGRRRGKALRPGLAGALAEVLPRYRLDLGHAAPDGLAALFAVPVRSVRLEIGFGGGEHLFGEAARFPETGFIGVEPFVNGMAKAAARLEEAPLPNLRLWDDDAAALLDWLPKTSLAGIDLFYPDPWPKKRHWKRRFVSGKNLDRFARVLVPGGRFRFASDIAGYVDWTLLACRAHPAFAWTARSADDWRKPFDGWPGTRYEAKALRAGRTPVYLEFQVLPVGAAPPPPARRSGPWPDRAATP